LVPFFIALGAPGDVSIIYVQLPPSGTSHPSCLSPALPLSSPPGFAFFQAPDRLNPPLLRGARHCPPNLVARGPPHAHSLFLVLSSATSKGVFVDYYHHPPFMHPEPPQPLPCSAVFTVAWCPAHRCTQPFYGGRVSPLSGPFFDVRSTPFFPLFFYPSMAPHCVSARV